MGFAKNRLASSQTSRRAPRARPGVAGAHHSRGRRPGTTQYTITAILTVAPRPAAALPAPFSYTHRPGCSGRHGPAGSWVDFPIPQNSFVWVLLKIGSRARATPNAAGGHPAAWPSARGHWGPQVAYPAPPTGLPYTPTSVPCTYPAPHDRTRPAPGPRRRPQPTYPAPQPAYPAPPSRPPYTQGPRSPTPGPIQPTLHPQVTYPAPPSHLPCTPESPTLHPRSPTLRQKSQVAHPAPPSPRAPTLHHTP
jgi:hypothetical protein